MRSRFFVGKDRTNPFYSAAMKPIALESSVFTSIWNLENTESTGTITFPYTTKKWKQWKKREAKLVEVKQSGSTYHMLLGVREVLRSAEGLQIRIIVLQRRDHADTHGDCFVDYTESRLRNTRQTIVSLQEKVELLEARLASLTGDRPAEPASRSPPPLYSAPRAASPEIAIAV